MVLARELVAEKWGHEDARRKIFIFVDGEAVACSDSVGVESLEEIGVGVLCVFPVENSGGKVGMECVGEDLEEWGGTVQNLGVNAVKAVEGGNVSHDPYLIAVQGRIVGDGVNVNGVGWVSPSLDLLSHLLGVWWGEDTGSTGVAKRVWEEVEQGGDSIRHTDWSEDTRAEERVATKGVEERVVGSRYVGVDPLNVGQLFNCELADWSFFAFANPF